MIVLASASPQRKTLLGQIGLEPLVIAGDIHETLDTADLDNSLRELADQKAKAAVTRIIGEKDLKTAFASINTFWIIGADTIVLLDQSILGKPGDERSAGDMIAALSGREHKVLTGVFAARYTREIEFGFMIQEKLDDVAETVVEFNNLTPEEVSWYVSTGEWQGAAGAYRIQGKGECIVSGIHGSFSNVVGLPIELIYGMLIRLGYSFETG